MKPIDWRPKSFSTTMNHLRSRLHIAIPVFVYGSDEQGDPFQEITNTLSVNPRGGLIGLGTPVKKGQKLLLVNLETDETIQCSVVKVRQNKIGKPLVGLAFNQSSPRYWNLGFPLDQNDSALLSETLE
jgi:hypothetical protein